MTKLNWIGSSKCH